MKAVAVGPTKVAAVVVRATDFCTGNWQFITVIFQVSNPSGASGVQMCDADSLVKDGSIPAMDEVGVFAELSCLFRSLSSNKVSMI